MNLNKKLKLNIYFISFLFPLNNNKEMMIYLIQ